MQPRLDAPVSPAVDLVREDDFEEGGVVQLLSSRQGDALGQGVEHGAQLEVLEQRSQVSGHRHVNLLMPSGGGNGRFGRKTLPGRAKRPLGSGRGAWGVVSSSRAWTRMRSTRRTSMRSTSRARRQAASSRLAV